MRKILAFSFLIFFVFNGISMASDPSALSNPVDKSGAQGQSRANSEGVRREIDSAEEFYRKGNSSYENGDYEKAISFYEELLKIDEVSEEVFYNLGNSYFKLKKIGKAILNYERALRLDPRDKDTQLNLKLAKEMTADKINTSERGFVLNALFFLYDKMNINELLLMSSLLYLAIILILIFSIFFVDRRRFLFYTAGTFGAIFFIFLIFLFTKIQNENFTKTGIIIAERADVRSGPKDDYLLQFTLHEGAKFSIVKEMLDWYEIELSKDLKGWIPKTSVDII